MSDDKALEEAKKVMARMLATPPQPHKPAVVARKGTTTEPLARDAKADQRPPVKPSR